MTGHRGFFVVLLLVTALLMTQCVAPSPAAPVAPAPAEPAPAAEAPAAAPAAPAPAEAPQPAAPSADLFLDVGKQPPITILINQSPWYPGFEKTVELYEQQTGNTVNLDVTPFAGMLEKSRNAVQGKESPYDLLNLNAPNTVEFYEGGFLTPLKEIDPTFELDPQVITADDTNYWSAEANWRKTPGVLMGIPLNSNIQLCYYRADLFEQAGLEPPETWDDVVAAADKLGDGENLYGWVVRGERGNAIVFDFYSYLYGAGGSIEKDPANGDYTVTVNSPEAKKALDFYVMLANKYGPPNSGVVGQADLIQLMTTGKALQLNMVSAAWASMDNPDNSQVIGKVNTTVVPRPTDGQFYTPIGNWVAGIPKNIPMERKQAVLAFAKWFLTYEAQYKYAEFGSIPVRNDVFESDLAAKPEFRWMEAYKEGIKYGGQMLGYKEGPQVETILGLRLNQALIGELSSAQALNLAAEEIYKVFSESGRKTGLLEKLPE